MTKFVAEVRTGLGSLRDSFPSGEIKRMADSLGTPQAIQRPSGDQAGAVLQAVPRKLGPRSLPIFTRASCPPAPKTASEFPSGDQEKPLA